jgi:serine/threonine protein kinase
MWQMHLNMAGNFEHVTYNVPAQAFKERYKKIKDLHGGMSTVLLAKDMKYKRKVVVKMFDPGKGDNLVIMQELAERFDLEAEISAQLNHSNTVRVYEAGRINDVYPFITMEYIDGRDLHKALAHVKQNDLFSLDEFLMIFYQICEPIRVAHEKGILNRDLKPQNILLGKYGDLKVCDWGIAKKLENKQSQEEVSLLDIGVQVMTAEGVVMGTPTNFPPEIIRGDSADERTDIYLLTSILYEAVTGHPPFSTKSEDYYRRMRDDDHEFDKSKLFIQEVRDIIELGMQTEQNNRYQTVADLQEDVLAFMNLNLIESYTPEQTGTVISRIFSSSKKSSSKKEPQRLILSNIVKKWASPLAKADVQKKLSSKARTKKFSRSRRSKRT